MCVSSKKNLTEDRSPLTIPQTYRIPILSHFGKKWIVITLILLAPLLLYEKFVGKISSDTQLLTSVPLLVISIGIVMYWMRKNGEIGWNKKVDNEIKNGKAQILKIQTDKVYKRKESFDLGSGFYLKISENETLFLQGQYLNELEYSRKFPNSEFEVVSTALTLNELIGITPLGEYLNPEKELKAFTKEQFENNDVHYNGDLLKIPIEQLR